MHCGSSQPAPVVCAHPGCIVQLLLRLDASVREAPVVLQSSRRVPVTSCVDYLLFTLHWHPLVCVCRVQPPSSRLLDGTLVQDLTGAAGAGAGVVGAVGADRGTAVGAVGRRSDDAARATVGRGLGTRAPDALFAPRSSAGSSSASGPLSDTVLDAPLGRLAPSSSLPLDLSRLLHGMGGSCGQGGSLVTSSCEPSGSALSGSGHGSASAAGSIA